jgi:hypothetical protein
MFKEIALHIWRPDERIATFYDRRWLAEFIGRMFPAGAVPDVIIQTEDDEGNVRRLCTVQAAVAKGREWLMCREPA